MSIKLSNVTYTYGIGTPFEKTALYDTDVEIHEGEFVGIIGHTGSGKSTLVNEILYKGMAEAVYGTPHRPGRFKALKGVEYIDKIINIDQSPIGRTPRSNPATYTGVF